MNLDDYFEVVSSDEIRIRGHRIGIESVLYEYIYRARTPDEIAALLPTLTREEVFATILYYFRHQQAVEQYLARWLEYGEQARRAQEHDAGYLRLREQLRQTRTRLLAEREQAIPVAQR